MGNDIVEVTAAPKQEAMRIVTGCTTEEQFINVFHRFCDSKTCFIPCAETRPVGSRLQFSLRLANGNPMLRGTCIVRQAWTTSDNPFNRPGVQLEIRKLTTDSTAVFEKLLAQRTAVGTRPRGLTMAPPVATAPAIVEPAVSTAAPAAITTAPPATEPTRTPVSEPATTPTEVLTVESATPTVQMPPLQYQTETRTPGSAYVLPANPLSDVDDAALEAFFACTVTGDGEDAPFIDPDDVLSIPQAPVVPDVLAIPRSPVVAEADDTQRHAAPARDAIATLLGVAPIAVVCGDTQRTVTPSAVLAQETTRETLSERGTEPTRAVRRRQPGSIAVGARQTFQLHSMTQDERFWLLCAISAGLLTALVVLASALASAG